MMKKKELLNMKPLIANKHMIDIARKDKPKNRVDSSQSIYGSKKKYYTYGNFYKVAIENEVLKVSIFPRKRLANGINTPQFDIYLSKEENNFLTYDLDEKKWRTAKINMLQIDHDNSIWCYIPKSYQTEQSRRMVNEYFDTGENLDIKEAVLKFQAKIREDSLQKKYRSEIEQIDATMNEVPEIPKDFDNWVIKNCFEETMFYKREKPHKNPKVYCTHCGEWMDAPSNPVHREKVKCPKCKTEATYRSWKKQKYVYDETSTVILQKLKDQSGYILRKFYCKIARNYEDGWENYEFYKHENVRARLDFDFHEVELFEYGEYRYSGITRWCHDCRRGFGYRSNSFGTGMMYTRNLKRVLKNQNFINMNLKKMFFGGEREYVNPAFVLQTIQQYPFVEFLQKSGLNRLVKEIMTNQENGDLFHTDKRKIHEVLGVDKQRFQRLRKLDGGSRILEFLQYEQRSGRRITDENIKYIEEEKINLNTLPHNKTKMSVSKTLNYLKRQQKKHGYEYLRILNYYRDYLDMAKERGMDITDEIVCKNSKMMEYHDKYLDEKNKAKASKRDAEVNKRFPNIKRDYKRNTRKFGYETDGYKIIVPKMASDITNEGRLQHHCVGASDQYIRKMDEHESFIVFMRSTENEDTPYYTIETKWNGKVLQFYAAYDRKPNKEEVEAFLKKWSKEVAKKIEVDKVGVVAAG